MTFTLGEAARHCGVAKGTISKAIKTGKLSATRREDGSWSIDNAELARYLEANRHRFPRETDQADQVETRIDELVELRVKAQLAEQLLAVLREQLADMTRQRDKLDARLDRLSLTAQKPEEPMSWWRWLRSTG